MTEAEIHRVFKSQADYFKTGNTFPLAFRKKALGRLGTCLEENTDDILLALEQDLGKNNTEAYVSEIQILLSEINFSLKHLKSWMRPKRVSTALINLPGSSRIKLQPLGNILIIGPWNYPFFLVLAPLINAIAAGNCAVIKPSELTPKSSSLLTRLIERCFPPEFISVIIGGPEIAQILTGLPFNHVFFTGSTQIGKKVMSACVENLTPCTLELGGKNPCIVDESANILLAAKRICWGKFFNAGQTCVAPDYLVVHTSIKHHLIKALITILEKFYGSNPAECPDFGRIVNKDHTNRLISLLRGGNLKYGGDSDVNQRYVGPTLLDNITWESPVMQEEIFGPILPILTYDKLEELVLTLSKKPSPLAVYFFSTESVKNQLLARTLQTGSLVFNTTFTQLVSNTLPFGGSGQSGMGRYRGKAGFDTFSRTVSLLSRHPRYDWPMIYPPYKTPLKMLKKVLPYFF